MTGMASLLYPGRVITCLCFGKTAGKKETPKEYLEKEGEIG